ncbi:MAG: peptide ABC transporter substrate-binding protein, partial [Lachnospiraceae bacterium]|nr:peptide ABC transporter substrate-binding protein [Lachnospiraceae bacterium]
MKKRLLALLLAAGMVVGTTACGGSAPAPAPAEEAAEEETEEEAEEAEAEEEPAEAAGYVEGAPTGGFGVAPLYFYTNIYCLKDGIENVEYTPFGYFFFSHATGKDEITACIASEPETIDPGLISSVDGSTYTQHQFEALMKYVSTGELAGDNPAMFNTEPDYGMAVSHEVSDDQLVYTFKLRDEAVWSDGEPVKAGDFVYSWRRIVNPETASDYGYILDGIVQNAAAIQAGEKQPEELGIEALDDKTLQITLEAPCPYFLELCAFASLMPLREDVIEQYGAEWTDPANIVTNGPFKITEWVHDSYIAMEQNDKYYDVASLGPKSIKYYLNDSETAIMSAYESGEYDFVENIPTDRIADLQASGDCFINPYVGTYYLYINCKDVPDWRVRAAIMLTIDQQNIVDNVTQGGQVPATGLVASGIADSAGKNFAEENAKTSAPMFAWLQENYADVEELDLNEYEDRCELAQILLEEAVAEGYDTSKTIYYRYNTSESHQKIAEAVQADVKGVLDLNIELSNQDWNVYTSGLAEHDFGLARLGWIADYNDPITYLELFTNGNSYNYGLYYSDEFTDLINQAKTLPAG